jgi:hypothetical protein
MKKPKLKDYITNVAAWLKVILLFLVMAIGFLAIYWTIWMLIGWPLELWSIILLVCFAALTEYGYYKWIDG